MTTQEKIKKQFCLMSKAMLSVERKEGATILYHIMADGIYWDDEIPLALDEYSEDCLRFIIRYRTALIMGEQADQWREYWDVAKKEFGGWIGFDKDRCMSSEILKEKCRRMRKEAEF